MINLNNRRDLPMYFLKERIKGLDFKINFATIEPPSVGDLLELEHFVYRIEQINEQRPSPLDYGVDVPVTFTSTVSRIVARIEAAGTPQRRDVAVNSEEDAFGKKESRKVA